MEAMTGILAAEIERLLVAAFAPSYLAVINDSARHSGHAGDDGSGESTSPWRSKAPHSPAFRGWNASAWSTAR